MPRFGLHGVGQHAAVESTTAFGVPSEPDVKSMTAGSSAS